MNWLASINVKSKNCFKREKAVKTLANSKDPKVVQTFVDLLTDPDSIPANAAEEALEKWAGTVALREKVPQLITMLQSADKYSCSRIVRVLGKARSPECIRSFLKISNDNIGETDRWSLVEKLLRPDEPAFDSGIEAALRDWSGEVRRVALYKLSKLGGAQAVNPLLKALQGNNTEDCIAAARHLLDLRGLTEEHQRSLREEVRERLKVHVPAVLENCSKALFSESKRGEKAVLDAQTMEVATGHLAVLSDAGLCDPKVLSLLFTAFSTGWRNEASFNPCKYMKLTAAATLKKIGRNIPDVAEHFIRAALGESGEGINPELARLIADALGSSSVPRLEAALEHRTGSERDMLLWAIALAKQA